MRTKVLMVCLGNICRSPLAEGILQNKVDPDRVFVDSAGTGGYHIGNPPDPRSIAVAKKYGIHIEDQRCRQFGPADFSEFDLIYAMDQSNYNNIIALASSQAEIEKVKLLLDEVDRYGREVPDPYWNDNGFEEVFEMIDAACEAIAKKL
ncbi:low molecular weight protein-tyrosine-phosphatase [Pseudozobellia thermophila]|uniref:protein-tyrosine-phosphatase n=1 Tax=Pseudozobellia thermophila TaxID=192903 RepID=A0A1M6FB35_9FLAO|nr:low molecular weight protein-tyrosine-phosphatase [Pseudozobellia thermophila]SHI94968.1 protein-tyrosine phosphatase [Pseudozobellia thermophila]